VTEFDAEAFDSQLTTAILGRRFTALDRVPSTQDLAREVAGESLRNPDGEVVLAEFQTQGRGRLRRACIGGEDPTRDTASARRPART